jgi:hypothetical protein
MPVALSFWGVVRLIYLVPGQPMGVNETVHVDGYLFVCIRTKFNLLQTSPRVAGI